jgi:hypothetical protein
MEMIRRTEGRLIGALDPGNVRSHLPQRFISVNMERYETSDVQKGNALYFFLSK